MLTDFDTFIATLVGVGILAATAAVWAWRRKRRDEQIKLRRDNALATQQLLAMQRHEAHMRAVNSAFTHEKKGGGFRL